VSFEASAVLLAWVALVFLALALSGLIRQVRYLARAVDATGNGGGIVRGGRIAGSAVVGSTPPGLEGLAANFDGRFAIIFAAGGCRSCDDRLKEIRDVAVSGGRLPIVVVHRDQALVPWESNGFHLESVYAPELFDSFNVVATPMAYTVDEQGAVVDALLLSSPTAVNKLVGALQGSP
jgi:hypothetical protein